MSNQLDRSASASITLPSCHSPRPRSGGSRFLARVVALGAILLGATGAAACVGTTGGELVNFQLSAVGAPSASGESLSFHTSAGFDVTLTTAKLTVNAFYLNRSRASVNQASDTCFDPMVYVGQVLQGETIDALSTTPQPFPVAGVGVSGYPVSAEVWLGTGQIDDPYSRPQVLSVAGTASKGGQSYPFTGLIHLGMSWQPPPTNAAEPGSNPICLQRIVSGIPLSLDLTPGATLTLTLLPAVWFDLVDFSTLTQVSTTPPAYTFDDEPDTQADTALYTGFHSISAYQVTSP